MKKGLVVLGSMFAVVGVFALFGAAFAYAANLFGYEVTWWQGTVVAFCLKLAGQLLAPTIKVGGAR